MKKIVFAIVLVLALSASAREAVSPTRIVWSTNATDVALLVSPRLGQVPEGRFLEGSGAKLTVGTNGISAVLLDEFSTLNVPRCLLAMALVFLGVRIVNRPERHRKARAA